jgi:ferredoxin-NADP reductase
MAPAGSAWPDFGWDEATSVLPTEADLYPLRVRSMTRESDGVLSVVLEDPGGAALPAWESGAHIDLRWGNGVERQYSLCGDRHDPFRWRIGILREPNGSGSAYAHDVLRPGDEVLARGPRCHFRLMPASRYIFIAGGIGITPILPMIDEVEARGATWELTYGGRQRASMAFLSELEKHGGRVRVHPQDEQGFLPLAEILDAPTPDTLVYCCGPEPLLAAVEEACQSWPDGVFHCERFAPKPGADEGPTSGFEVVLARSGRRFSIPPDKGILEVLKEAGLDVAYSCEEGTCGTCEAVVTEGTPDHRDSVLSDDERREGRTMMICVSRALSDTLVLDL